MSELKTLQTLLAEKQKRIKEIEARIASIEGTDKPEAKPIKALVATDADGEVYLYKYNPQRLLTWLRIRTEDAMIKIDADNLPFPAPKWEDEPVEVEITIKKV